ncbi:hypothetical protein [uncultured Eubacterium sp.]|uniref:hypothetical protein n=1 Tax=uncultured Eubacterium sp. TaxID=165185 RepID=UPI0025CEB2B2|nr:hypothetical protein [uncultured Eubacterium sp.]
MAPAARTVSEVLYDTNTTPDDYDLILTGDLGFTGTQLLYKLLEREYDINIASRHKDCGLMIYDLEGQDVNSGGSGCGIVCENNEEALYEAIKKVLINKELLDEYKEKAKIRSKLFSVEQRITDFESLIK